MRARRMFGRLAVVLALLLSAQMAVNGELFRRLNSRASELNAAGQTLTLPLHTGERVMQRRRSAEQISLNNSQTAGEPSAYLVAVNVGTPPQEMFLLVDTGSSNIALSALVGHPPIYNVSKSTTARVTGGTVGVTYVESSWSGPRIADYVQIVEAPDTRVFVEFGAITSANNFFLPGTVYDGILGMAFLSLAAPSNNPIVPYFDVLTQQIPSLANVFSLQLCTQDRDRVQADGDGLMTIGGLSPTASSGPVVYTPLQAQTYYAVQVTAMAVGTQRLPLSCGQYNSPGFSIVDSGTTDLILPGAVYDALLAAVPPNVRTALAGGDSVCIGNEAASYLNSFFPTLVFTLAGTDPNTEFDLPVRPSHYFRFLEYNNFQKCYITTLARGCNPGSGVTLGVAMMTEYQVVFDRANSRVGFAVSTCANLGSTQPIAIKGPYPRSNLTSCATVSTPCTPTKPSPFTTLFYVAVACGGVALLVIAFLLIWCWRTRSPSAPRNTVRATSPARALLSDDELNSLHHGYGPTTDLALDMPGELDDYDYDADNSRL
eukprot:m.93332 g.93332  ORF g.93332 m.93332 type:complete len:544 (+) comp13805_c0_seq3:192-1823(+)